MKKFGYRFALIAGVTSLLVSVSIAPVTLAKTSGKNPVILKNHQKIAFLPAVIGGGVVATETVIKIISIYIGLCGLKNPVECGENTKKALDQINAHFKQLGSKVTMTIEQAYEMVSKNKDAIVALSPPGKVPKKPRGSNNIVKSNLVKKNPVEPPKLRTDEEDDNTACNGINSIFRIFMNRSLSESFQKTREFREYNIIVCISKKIPNKEQLTEKLKGYIEKAGNDKNFHRQHSLSEKPLPLKETATIYISSLKKENDFIDAMDTFERLDNRTNNKPSNNKKQVSNSVSNSDLWYFFKHELFSKNTILILQNFQYGDVVDRVYGVALAQKFRGRDKY